MDKTEIKTRLEFHKAAAERLRVAYITLVDGGAQSYSIGSRSLTKFDLETIHSEIKEHEKAISGLTVILNGGKRRKAVAVVPRDW